MNLQETQMQLIADDNQRFVWFLSSNALDDGFIQDDNLIIIAELCVKESGHENELDHGAGITDSIKSGFQDFRGLGKIEKGFIQLLEELCSKHPTLIESQVKRNRSQRFTEWSFTALGRVLHFLKTKKVKDMNDDTCKELQILWEELETFGFDDLTWLEPHVQSALGMKNYMERAVQVTKLKENVADLEVVMKNLKAKMAAAEVDLEIARKELRLCKERFG